jgi:hypothetical protein
MSPGAKNMKKGLGALGTEAIGLKTVGCKALVFLRLCERKKVEDKKRKLRGRT